MSNVRTQIINVSDLSEEKNKFDLYLRLRTQHFLLKVVPDRKLLIQIVVSTAGMSGLWKSLTFPLDIWLRRSGGVCQAVL